MSTFGDTLAAIDAEYSMKVIEATFGHLAPERNKKYKIRIVYAIGCIGNDPFNPTIIAHETGELESSPWLFDALQEFLGLQNNAEGCVYEVTGTMRNYKFNCYRKLLLNSNS